MFQKIEGMPENVVAIRGIGRITGDDYRGVLGPAIDKAISGGRKARLYLELGREFEGYDASAMLADTSVGVESWRSFERIAVVTDTDWIRHAIHLFGPLIPGDVRAFTLADLEAARAWIAA
jgi:hypothetical protein